MHFLSGNAPIMSIARRFGMDIVTAAGFPGRGRDLCSGRVTFDSSKGSPATVAPVRPSAVEVLARRRQARRSARAFRGERLKNADAVARKADAYAGEIGDP